MPPRISTLEFLQLSDRLNALRVQLPHRAPPRGWIRTIRKAVGMTTSQLAARLGISQPSVVRAEERETTGAISIQTLRRMAHELDCELVYFLVPRTTLQEHVGRRAEAVATAESVAAAHQVGLQWQVVPPIAVAQQIEAEKARLVAERPPRLWDPVEGE